MSAPELEAFWQEAWVLLDDGRAREALALAGRQLDRAPDLAEGHYVAGVAHGDLDDVEASLEHHARAAMLAPDWDEAVVMHVAALHRACRFAEAREILGALEEQPPQIALYEYLIGLLAERDGDEASARAAFSRAAALDPETYPLGRRLDEARVQSLIEAALLRLPEPFRDALDNIAIVLESIPDEATLTAESPPIDPEILGLYVGTPLTARSLEASGQSPDVVYLFQRNLERQCETDEELEREIAITLYHEIAHALGFEEEDMSSMGLD